jgi:acyl dehydratase
MIFWEDFQVGERFEMGRHTFTEAGFFGGLVASGWHTCAVAMRLIVEQRVLFVHEVLAARASATRPGVGLVKHRWEATNQRGDVTLAMEGWGMFGRRPAA